MNSVAIDESKQCVRRVATRGKRLRRREDGVGRVFDDLIVIIEDAVGCAVVEIAVVTELVASFPNFADQSFDGRHVHPLYSAVPQVGCIGVLHQEVVSKSEEAKRF